MSLGSKLKPIPYTHNGCDQCWNCSNNTSCNSTRHEDGMYYIHPECKGLDITSAQIPCQKKAELSSAWIRN